MASVPNAADPDPAAAPAPVAAVPAQQYAPARPTFTSAPVGWVIAAMLVFWPTGIPALLASHRAARAFGAGDVEAAQRESGNARRWGIISVIVGACLVVFWILVSLAWVAFLVLATHHMDRVVWEDGQGWSNDQPFGGPVQPGIPMPQHQNRNG